MTLLYNANLRENVSYGQKLKKGSQHACNYKLAFTDGAIHGCFFFRYLVIENFQLLEGHTKANLSKLTITTRKIIMQNSNNANAMRNDLQNGPLHVFGRHEHCQQYYCNWKVTHTVQDVDLVEKLQKDGMGPYHYSQ